MVPLSPPGPDLSASATEVNTEMPSVGSQHAQEGTGARCKEDLDKDESAMGTKSCSETLDRVVSVASRAPGVERPDIAKPVAAAGKASAGKKRRATSAPQAKDTASDLCKLPVTSMNDEDDDEFSSFGENSRARPAASHRSVEKRRRDRINTLIDELAGVVSPPGVRRPKHTVLSDTLVLLNSMRQAIACSERRIAQLNAEAAERKAKAAAEAPDPNSTAGSSSTTIPATDLQCPPPPLDLPQPAAAAQLLPHAVQPASGPQPPLPGVEQREPELEVKMEPACVLDAAPTLCVPWPQPPSSPQQRESSGTNGPVAAAPDVAPAAGTLGAPHGAACATVPFSFPAAADTEHALGFAAAADAADVLADAESLDTLDLYSEGPLHQLDSVPSHLETLAACYGQCPMLLAAGANEDEHDVTSSCLQWLDWVSETSSEPSCKAMRII